MRQSDGGAGLNQQWQKCEREKERGRETEGGEGGERERGRMGGRIGEKLKSVYKILVCKT